MKTDHIRGALLIGVVAAACGFALENLRLRQGVAAKERELLSLRTRSVSAAAEERRRLERDLHDSTQQRLLSLLARVSAIRLTTENKELLAELEGITIGLKETLTELRGLTDGPGPEVLRRYGLSSAVKSLVGIYTLPVSIDIPETRFNEEVEATVYFVVAEALSNVFKHAHATNAEISVRYSNGKVDVIIIDDGIGGADPTKGTGLLGIADRVHSHGGDLTIGDYQGHGSRLKVTIPCA